MKENPLIECACGCGQLRHKYYINNSNFFIERKYIQGHNYNQNKLFKEKIFKKGIPNPKHSETMKRLYKEGKIIPPMLGKKLSEESIKKRLETKKRLYAEGKLKVGNKGTHLSEDTKRKISFAKKEYYKNNPLEIEKKKRLLKEQWKNPIYREKFIKGSIGKKLSEEHKKKIGDSERGEKSYLWKGGISFEPYGIEFNKQLKEQIRTRDNHTCQECNFTEEQLGYKLSVHHIDFNKKNNNPNNLISLCRSCHTQTSFDREKWIKYFQNKLGCDKTTPNKNMRSDSDDIEVLH